MISFAFILCSTLLLSGAIAQEEKTHDLQPRDAVVEPEDSIQVEASKQAAAAAIKVLNDLMDGVDIKKSLLDRGIEALGKIRGAAASMGQSFLKRLKELREGKPIGEVAGNIWNAINRKFTGKNKNYDEIVNATGSENIQKFISKTTEIIYESIMEAMKKRREEAAAAEAAAQKA